MMTTQEYGSVYMLDFHSDLPYFPNSNLDTVGVWCTNPGENYFLFLQEFDLEEDHLALKTELTEVYFDYPENYAANLATMVRWNKDNTSKPGRPIVPVTTATWSFKDGCFDYTAQAREEFMANGKIEGLLLLSSDLKKIWVSHYDIKSFVLVK